MSSVAAVPAEPALFDIELPAAPYPGLRPFERHEWPIFFGREPMIRDVIAHLDHQNLVVVHGDSGCGKSSLIRAGVLVQLEQQHERGAQNWRTCAMLPREAPLRSLANELAKLDASDPDRNRIRQIRRCLNLGRDAPAALAELLSRGEDDHVCILIDQFEELFSFARKHSRDEAQLFVDILVGLQADPPPGLHVILTMRSEFLGVCARFRGLAEAVNKTQYLLPQMERPALLRAIREPATLYDGEVSRELAERLIADAGGEQDQLPLIQHGLMRLWRRKAGPPPARGFGLPEAGAPLRHGNVLTDAHVPFRQKTGSDEPVARPGYQGDDAPPPSFSYGRGPAWRLALEDYQGGGLASLLSDHADEVMAQAVPDPERQKVVEHLFRALTDINAEGSAIRRPQTLGELVEVTGSEEQTLREVLGHFRAEGVSFLAPYGNAPIGPDTLIDISHEALIRCWRKIADKEGGWLQREFQDGLTWQSLRMQADKFGKDKEETLSAASTVDRDAWLATLPSKDWCRRYRGGWEAVQTLMQASRDARARQISKDLWIRGGLIAVSVVFIALTALAGWNWRQATRAQEDLREALQTVEAALAKATTAEAEAQKAREGAQLGDSLFRAFQARQELDRGVPETAMLLALEGLPGELGARPWAGEPAGALAEAIAFQPKSTTLVGHGDLVRAAAFSPDGARIVSASDDRTVRVWDAASGRELLVLRGHEDWVRAAAFSPDGTRIVSASDDRTVRVWDAKGGVEPLILSGHENWVLAAAFSPDGARVVSGSADGTVRVWSTARGIEPRILRGHEAPVWAAAFSPDGTRIVSASDDRTVRVWDAASGDQLLLLSGHEGVVYGAAFSPDGARIVSGSEDGTVRVWSAASGMDLRVLRGHEAPVWAAGFSADSTRVVSAAEDGTVRVWDAASGDQLLQLSGHEGAVYAAAFSPDGGRISSGSSDRTVRVWDIATGLILRGHEGPAYATAFSPDGARIVSGSEDGTVRVWDAASREELLVLQGHESAVYTTAFSRDGNRIVSGSADSTLRVWDAASGAELLVLGGHEGWVLAVAFSPDGARIVSGSADRTVRVWDAASGKELLVLRGHGTDQAEESAEEGWVQAAAFSPDGARIVSGSNDNTVRVWDVASGAELLVLRGHESDVWAAGFSPDGARIVSGSASLWGGEDNTVRVWDAASGAELMVLRGHQENVEDASFSPDGARIVSASYDDTVRVWDVSSGESLLVLRGYKGNVNAAAFAPDGTQIVSGSDDGTVRVTWVPRSKQELIETARARLPRELTEEERRRFYLTVE